VWSIRTLFFKKEDGNVTIFGLFLVLAAIAGMVYLSYYYGGFITRRQAQNAVDSAAVAAVIELRNKFEEKMQDKTEQTVNTFIEEVKEEVRRCEDNRDVDDPPCPTVEEIIEQRIQGDELEDILVRDKKINPKEDWVLVVMEKHFEEEYKAEKNGDVLYDTYIQYSSDIKNAALESMEKNDGKADVTIVFPVDQKPKLTVEGAKVYNLDSLVTGSAVDVPAVAAAGVNSPDVPINVANKVPARIR
jgi:hypothetical protein